MRCDGAAEPRTEPRAVLRAHGLRKRYGDVVALDGVDLTLTPGVTVLLGPNGSGKTSLLRILATVVLADSGTITWNRRPVPDPDRSYQSALGYLPQDFSFQAGITPRQFLHYMARLKGLTEAQAGRQFDPAIVPHLEQAVWERLRWGEDVFERNYTFDLDR